MTQFKRMFTVLCLCLLFSTAVFAFGDGRSGSGAAPVLGQDLAVQLRIPLFDQRFAETPVASTGITPVALRELWPAIEKKQDSATLSTQFKQALEQRLASGPAADGPVRIFADGNIARDGSLLVEIPLFADIAPELPVALVNDEPVTLAEFSEDLQSVHNEMSGSEAETGSKENIKRLMDRLITVRLIEQEARNIGFDQSSSFKKQADEFAEKSLLYALLNKQLESRSLDVEAVDELYRKISLQGKFENYQFKQEKDATALLEKAKQGQDFDTLIAEAIERKQVVPGEQEDFLKFKDLLPNIASEAAQLEVGGISQIFRQADGFLIFKLVDRQFVEDPSALDYARKNVWERQKAEFATEFITELVDSYSEFDEQAEEVLDFARIKEANPDIQLGEALEPLLEDQRVLVTVNGPTPVRLTVADLARKIKDNYFHGVAIDLDAKEVDVKKQQILDDTLFRIAGTMEAQKLGLDQTLKYRMEVAEFERRLLFDIFMAKIVTPEVRYGEEEVETYYEKHKSEYMTPAMYKIKSLPFYRQADADTAVEKLRGGSDFKWVSANSEGLVDVQNEDLLQFDRNILSLSSLPASLKGRAAEAKRGDSLVYSEPDGFFYVLYFENVYSPEPRPYEQVRQDILNNVYQEKVAATLDEWVGKLKEAYETKIFLVMEKR